MIASLLGLLTVVCMGKYPTDSSNWQYNAEWVGGNLNDHAVDQTDERVVQRMDMWWMMCLGPNPLHNNGNCLTVIILLLQGRRWEHCVMTGALFAVDTFLTLSGVLLCYIFMVTMSKMGNFNLIIYFLHRYMR
jgi:hypothetical protein